MSKTLTFSKYAKLPLLWPRIVSLWSMVEKLLLCQLLFRHFFQNEENELKAYLF